MRNIVWACAILLTCSVSLATPSGGMLQRPSNGRCVLVVNSQSDVAASDIREMVGVIGVAIDVMTVLDCDVKDAALTISLVSTKDDPLLALAPESAWAKINVAKLKGNGASGRALSDRTKKELIRAIAFLLGAGHSQFLPDLMGPIRQPEELDAFKGIMLCPEAYNAIKASAKLLNLRPARMVTYRQACSEGWAPVPTNDIQKAIWDEVRTPPSKPLKITYDKDKQKPVVK